MSGGIGQNPLIADGSITKVIHCDVLQLPIFLHNRDKANTEKTRNITTRVTVVGQPCQESRYFNGAYCWYQCLFLTLAEVGQSYNIYKVYFL